MSEEKAIYVLMVTSAKTTMTGLMPATPEGVINARCTFESFWRRHRSMSGSSRPGGGR